MACSGVRMPGIVTVMCGFETQKRTATSANGRPRLATVASSASTLSTSAGSLSGENICLRRSVSVNVDWVSKRAESKAAFERHARRHADVGGMGLGKTPAGPCSKRLYSIWKTAGWPQAMANSHSGMCSRTPPSA